jgi:hypothetical protein
MRIFWRLALQGLLIGMVSLVIFVWSSLSMQHGSLLTTSISGR